ncbi:MAG TPA: chorismate synthase [Actinomycetota bacterium]|nr:chorismate synthase [Actinomycetota bacterium]
MLRFLTAGESHGPELVVVVEGLPAGVPVSLELLDRDLGRRQAGYGRGARSTKIERDRALVVSGLAEGRTTGAPVAVRVVNRDFANQPANPAPLTAPRPGHADLPGRLKYGHEDFRVVRERASARETAARTVAGSLARQLLSPFGVWVGSFVVEVGDVAARDPRVAAPDLLDEAALRELAEAAEADPLRCPDPEASARMREAVDRAKEAGETLGGVFWVVATGVPPGLGSYVQWDRKLDGRLAQAVGSIHAVKGVEVGRAFELARLPGSRAQDEVVWRDGRLARSSNHAGGLEGGVTNGQPVLVRAAMKPLSSVRVPVATVDFTTGQAVAPPYVRTDVCSVPAAAVVGEAMVAWVLAEALVERFGGDRLDLMLAAAREAERTALPAGLQPPQRASQAGGGPLPERRTSGEGGP